jgi:steroid delta-isomerase-like uncharacterized protein
VVVLTTEKALGVDGAVTEAWYREVWLPAWNSHDPEAVLATLTEDAVFADTGWPRPFVGRAQWRIPMSQLWTAFPDLTFALAAPPMLMHGRATVAFHYSGTGTMTGPLGRHPATGRALIFQAIEVLSFRDGLVHHWWGVADMADHYRQIGVAR